MFLLLSCWIITGVMADDPAFIHYGLKDSSVCLHVQNKEADIKGRWKFEEKVIASEGQVNPEYTAKAVHHHGNLSLCINELTDRDAGTYKFSFYDSWTEVTERHTVIVEEKVPEPVITISGLRFNLSAGLCNFTVNCSVQHERLSSVCEADGCRTSQSFSDVNITISTNNRSVVCRGNNHVSTNDVTESIDACFSAFDHELKAPGTQLDMIIRIVAVCVFICGCMVFLAKVHFSPACCLHQEHAAQCIQSQPTSASSYENVGVMQEAI